MFACLRKDVRIFCRPDSGQNTGPVPCGMRHAEIRVQQNPNRRDFSKSPLGGDLEFRGFETQIAKKLFPNAHKIKRENP